jgi:translation elongation factor EF-1beta
MPQCSAIKRSGTRCTASVRPGDEWCWNHDPANADKRRRNASRAGTSTGGREIKDLKRRISEVIDAVLDGSQDRGRAAVGIQGLNALRSVLELERRVREADELEARLREVEAVIRAEREEGRKWG